MRRCQSAIVSGSSRIKIKLAYNKKYKEKEKEQKSARGCH